MAPIVDSHNNCDEDKNMTRKETTSIALKCFAIYIIAQVFISLPIIATLGLKIGYFGRHDTSGVFVASVCLLSVVVALLFAFLLWKFTNSLLLKDTSATEFTSELGVDETIKIILACMGIFYATNAIIAFPRAYVEFQLAKSNPNFLIEITTINLVAIVLQFVLGCFLIIKPSCWLNLIRSAGRNNNAAV